ncbi:TrmH family RNA methyltransferase [Congregibacter litoralis]|uniref:rRNA methylase n=1 Tax=Congregibacter litoralis KT71 TaxID=314285 RepID=A4A877_9GAMM|nr:RNA methyltransferase [Congregibacter litoralis]EAQ97873.1 rRNA methylase [Congregibacter litoralis KT71]
MSQQGKPDRQERRRFLTIYGRKAVLEALQDEDMDCRILHMANSNRGGGIIRDIQRAAQERGLDCREHSREELARISRNGRQDQGVALDVYCAAMGELDAYLRDMSDAPQRILALDGVTNPQNMGMVIRSAAAAGIQGLIYADRGNPALGPLVIKASAGTVFRAPLLRCQTVMDGARQLSDAGFTLYRLQADGRRSLFDGQDFAQRALFVLGGESDGISEALRGLPGENLSIPMRNGVESLNVAVSGALVAYIAATVE